MPGISQRRFHSTIQRPAAEALDFLAPHSVEIFHEWQRVLQEQGLESAEFLKGPLDFSQLADDVRESPYPAFRQRIQEFGEHLAHQGVRLDHTVAAVNRLFEICIPYLLHDAPKRASPILAL